MALVSAALSSSLLSSWLPGDDGPYSSSAAESADAFAGAVAGWFGAATAGPYPCTTAAARRAQLSSSAAGALAAGQSAAAGAMLAVGVSGYFAGQVFGPGLASPPVGTAIAQAAYVATFADLGAARQARADRIAQATWGLALTTIVVFPPVISPPLPVT